MTETEKQPFTLDQKLACIARAIGDMQVSLRELYGYGPRGDADFIDGPPWPCPHVWLKCEEDEGHYCGLCGADKPDDE